MLEHKTDQVPSPVPPLINSLPFERLQVDDSPMVREAHGVRTAKASDASASTGMDANKTYLTDLSLKYFKARQRMLRLLGRTRTVLHAMVKLGEAAAEATLEIDKLFHVPRGGPRVGTPEQYRAPLIALGVEARQLLAGEVAAGDAGVRRRWVQWGRKFRAFPWTESRVFEWGQMIETAETDGPATDQRLKDLAEEVEQLRAQLESVEATGMLSYEVARQWLRLRRPPHAVTRRHIWALLQTVSGFNRLRQALDEACRDDTAADQYFSERCPVRNVVEIHQALRSYYAQLQGSDAMRPESRPDRRAILRAQCFLAARFAALPWRPECLLEWAEEVYGEMALEQRRGKEAQALVAKRQGEFVCIEKEIAVLKGKRYFTGQRRGLSPDEAAQLLEGLPNRVSELIPWSRRLVGRLQTLVERLLGGQERFEDWIDFDDTPTGRAMITEWLQAVHRAAEPIIRLSAGPNSRLRAGELAEMKRRLRPFCWTGPRLDAWFGNDLWELSDWLALGAQRACEPGAEASHPGAADRWRQISEHLGILAEPVDFAGLLSYGFATDSKGVAGSVFNEATQAALLRLPRVQKDMINMVRACLASPTYAETVIRPALERQELQRVLEKARDASAVLADAYHQLEVYQTERHRRAAREGIHAACVELQRRLATIPWSDGPWASWAEAARRDAFTICQLEQSYLETMPRLQSQRAALQALAASDTVDSRPVAERLDALWSAALRRIATYRARSDAKGPRSAAGFLGAFDFIYEPMLANLATIRTCKEAGRYFRREEWVRPLDSLWNQHPELLSRGTAATGEPSAALARLAIEDPVRVAVSSLPWKQDVLDTWLKEVDARARQVIIVGQPLRQAIEEALRTRQSLQEAFPDRYGGTGDHACAERPAVAGVLARAVHLYEVLRALRCEVVENAYIVKHVWSEIHAIKVKSIEPEDLYQGAMMGVLSALSQWHPKYNVSFPCYATFWLRNGIFRAIQDQASLVARSAYRRKKAGRSNKARGRARGIPEVALQGADIYPDGEGGLVSLDQLPAWEVDQLTAATVSQNTDPLESWHHRDADALIDEVFRELSPHQQALVRFRYYHATPEPLPYPQIGQLFGGQTRYRVRADEVALLAALTDDPRIRRAGYLYGLVSDGRAAQGGLKA